MLMPFKLVLLLLHSRILYIVKINQIIPEQNSLTRNCMYCFDLTSIIFNHFICSDRPHICIVKHPNVRARSNS